MHEMKKTIEQIERMMAPSLNQSQSELLHAVLQHCLDDETIESDARAAASNGEMLSAFLSAKRLEGCSERTIGYYTSVLTAFLGETSKGLRDVTTDDVRAYLISYGERAGVCKVTVDNVRRVISSLFSWLEAEDYVLKSPVRRIKKIRSPKSMKPVISDEEMEALRDGCKELRDLALVDLLA